MRNFRIENVLTVVVAICLVAFIASCATGIGAQTTVQDGRVLAPWIPAGTEVHLDSEGWNLDNPTPDFVDERTRIVIEGNPPVIRLQAVFWNPSLVNGQQISVDRVWQPADFVPTGNQATPLVVDNCDQNACYGHIHNSWLE